MDHQQIFPYFQPNFLDAASCARIIALAQASEDVFERDAKDAFWDKRVIHVLRLPDSPTKELIIANRQATKHALLALLGTRVELYADTLQIVRWPAGNALQPHADKENPDGAPHPYPYRDFASIVYLNANFEGGEIYFPRHNLVYKPEPGTLVIFPGTLEYAHGVREISQGMRYTLASFFTFDGQYQDPLPL